MARPASRRASQSGSSSTTFARLARMVWVALPMLWRSWVSARASLAASWNFTAGVVGSGSTSRDISSALVVGILWLKSGLPSAAVPRLRIVEPGLRSRRGSRRGGSG